MQWQKGKETERECGGQWWRWGEMGKEQRKTVGRWVRRTGKDTHPRRRCCLAGPAQRPSVIMALIAEEQRASAWESHVKYGTFRKKAINTWGWERWEAEGGGGSPRISPPVMLRSWQLEKYDYSASYWENAVECLLMSVFPTSMSRWVSETHQTTLPHTHKVAYCAYTVWFKPVKLF